MCLYMSTSTEQTIPGFSEFQDTMETFSWWGLSPVGSLCPGVSSMLVLLMLHHIIDFTAAQVERFLLQRG